MASTLEELDENIKAAFRAAWGAVVKATTGAQTTIAATTGGYTRSAGSFLTDGFGLGDELTASGFSTAANNGLSVVEYVDATTLRVNRTPWPDAVALVAESAGAAVTLAMALPSVQKLDGWQQEPVVGRPWLRESYQPVGDGCVSLRAPTARVRRLGTYWLTPFYPASLGGDGPTRLRGKIGTLIYPDVGLIANGQLVRVTRRALKTLSEEPEWVGAPIAFTFYADTFNPA